MTYLLLLVWIVPFFVVAFAIRKSTVVSIGLCEAHLTRRVRAKYALVAGLLGAPALWVAAGVTGSTFLGWLGLAVLMAGLIWASIDLRLVSATKMDDHFVRIAGVNRELIALLPDWRDVT